MATQVVTPTKLQKLEFNATTAEGVCRVTVVTGEIHVYLQVGSAGAWATQSVTYKALVDPTLTAGHFRKATATASISNATHNTNAAPSNAQWIVEEVQATYDDEAGQVQLTIDAAVGASGNGSNTGISKILFQVTTLAKV